MAGVVAAVGAEQVAGEEELAVAIGAVMAGWRTLFCSLPGLTTAVRLNVHFWWNVVETLLALCAGHVFLRGLPSFNEFPPRSSR